MLCWSKSAARYPGYCFVNHACIYLCRHGSYLQTSGSTLGHLVDMIVVTCMELVLSQIPVLLFVSPCMLPKSHVQNTVQNPRCT